MRTSTKRITLLATASLTIAALAGCAQTSTGNTTDPGAGSGTSSSAPAESTPSASPTPALDNVAIGGETTQVTLDSGFVDALTSLKLTPGVVGDAKLSSAGVLTFPITGGTVTYYDPSTGVRPYVQGEIDHEGSGLSLTAGDKKVELTDFVIDPGNDSHIDGKVSLNGKVVAESANLFRLDGSTLNPVSQDSDGNYVLEGTTVYVSEDAASLLNSTFGTTAVTGDLKVGIAKLTVSAKS